MAATASGLIAVLAMGLATVGWGGGLAAAGEGADVLVLACAGARTGVLRAAAATSVTAATAVFLVSGASRRDTVDAEAVVLAGAARVDLLGAGGAVLLAAAGLADGLLTGTSSRCGFTVSIHTGHACMGLAEP